MTKPVLLSLLTIPVHIRQDASEQVGRVCRLGPKGLNYKTRGESDKEPTADVILTLHLRPNSARKQRTERGSWSREMHTVVYARSHIRSQFQLWLPIMRTNLYYASSFPTLDPSPRLPNPPQAYVSKWRNFSTVIRHAIPSFTHSTQYTENQLRNAKRKRAFAVVTTSALPGFVIALHDREICHQITSSGLALSLSLASSMPIPALLAPQGRGLSESFSTEGISAFNFVLISDGSGGRGMLRWHLERRPSIRATETTC